MATVTERLERIETLLAEPHGGWQLIPLINQARAAFDEVARLRRALTAAQRKKDGPDG